MIFSFAQIFMLAGGFETGADDIGRRIFCRFTTLYQNEVGLRCPEGRWCLLRLYSSAVCEQKWRSAAQCNAKEAPNMVLISTEIYRDMTENHSEQSSSCFTLVVQ